jgi:hypothetical protein
MARKKKGKKSKTRRRVGGISKEGIKTVAMYIAGGIAGVVGGRLINNTMATTNGTLMGGAEVLVGGAIAFKVKNPLMKGIGIGLAANGGLYALGSKGLAVLPASMGYGPPMQQGYRSINGYRDVPKIGFPKPNAIGRSNNMESSRVARMYAGIYN